MVLLRSCHASPGLEQAPHLLQHLVTRLPENDHSSEVHRIREAQADDAADISRILIEAREAAYRGLLPDRAVDWMRTQMDTRRWEAILRAARRPTYEIVVALVEGEVAAYADWSCEREGTSGAKVGELLSLFVSPTHWNLGVGGELLRHAEMRLHRLGFTDAILWVLQDNQRARRVYERAGWVADGTSVNLDLGGCLIAQLRYRKALHRSAVPSCG